MKRKKCNTCGKSYGRRTIRDGFLYCSNDCRLVIVIEQALSKEDAYYKVYSESTILELMVQRITRDWEGMIVGFPPVKLKA